MCGVPVYKREFQRFLAAYFWTNTHPMAVDVWTEYVWDTCVDWSPGYLHDHRTVTEFENIKPTKCRVRVYKREFLGGVVV